MNSSMILLTVNFFEGRSTRRFCLMIRSYSSTSTVFKLFGISTICDGFDSLLVFGPGEFTLLAGLWFIVGVVSTLGVIGMFSASEAPATVSDLFSLAEEAEGFLASEAFASSVLSTTSFLDRFLETALLLLLSSCLEASLAENQSKNWTMKRRFEINPVYNY